MSGRPIPYTDEELQIIERAIKKGFNAKEIALVLKSRTVNSINRIVQLKYGGFLPHRAPIIDRSAMALLEL